MADDRWQPMEAAPNDSSVVLVACPASDGSVYVRTAFQNWGRWFLAGSYPERLLRHHPVAWQPTPAPPVVGESHG